MLNWYIPNELKILKSVFLIAAGAAAVIDLTLAIVGAYTVYNWLF
jgi:hypothetical protein